MRKLKKSAWENARKVTSTFEGSGYANITGDFDGMGLSLGLLQWNFGQSTLQPLFKRLFNEYPTLAKEVLQEGADELKGALERNAVLAYAKQAMNNNGTRIVEPWLSRLKKLCGTKEFQMIQDDAARPYIDKAVAMCHKFNVFTERAFCLFFDIAVQNGSVVRPLDVSNMGYMDKLKAIVNAVVAQSNVRWQVDVRSRKESIVNGKGIVHGGAVSFNISDSDAFEPEMNDVLSCLKNAGIINSPEYWLENAVEGKLVRGDYAAVVIIKTACKTQEVSDITGAVEVLQKNGIIVSPDYWLQNAVEGQQVNGDYFGLLMQKIAEKLKMKLV